MTALLFIASPLFLASPLANVPLPIAEGTLSVATMKFALILARTAGLFSVFPLGGDIVPGRIRVTVAIVVALFLFPLAPPAAPGAFPLQLVAEGTVGLLAALLAWVPLGAVDAGMQISSVSSGLGIASLLNPATEEEVYALTELFSFTALILFFAMGGHQKLILSLAESLSRVPPGGARLSADSLKAVVYLGSELFVLSIQVAAPLLLVSLAVHLAMALVARAAPAVNILSVSLVAILLLGLVMILRGLPNVASIVRHAADVSAGHYLLGFRP
jgi:flagellar biosynthetic protein FliR